MPQIKKGTVRVGYSDYTWRVLRLPRWTMGRIHGYTLLGIAILVEPSEHQRGAVIRSHRSHTTVRTAPYTAVRTRRGTSPRQKRAETRF